MFELRKSFSFEASHVLTQHQGKCSRLHGHSYVMTLVLRGRALQRSGPQHNMLTDFCDVSAAAKGMIATFLDHHHLNDTLKTGSPTAEFIARWAYRHLATTLPQLAEVELRETASAVVIYRPSRSTRENMHKQCQLQSLVHTNGKANINGLAAVHESNDRLPSNTNQVHPDGTSSSCDSEQYHKSVLGCADDGDDSDGSYSENELETTQRTTTNGHETQMVQHPSTGDRQRTPALAADALIRSDTGANGHPTPWFK
jgi:6-pyruvoyltetrahydropterin/6-carboxytetrahydropterin synthase